MFLSGQPFAFPFLCRKGQKAWKDPQIKFL